MDQNETGLWNRMRRNVLQGVGWEGEWVGMGMSCGKECAMGLKRQRDVRRWMWDKGGCGQHLGWDGMGWDVRWEEGRFGEVG